MRTVSTGELTTGLQLTGNNHIRITTPLVSVAATGDESVTTTHCKTGAFAQQIVSEIHDNGNGTVGWHYGTMRLNFIDGLFTSYTTVGMS